jgi:hypothetical protein
MTRFWLATHPVVIPSVARDLGGGGGAQLVRNSKWKFHNHDHVYRERSMSRNFEASFMSNCEPAARVIVVIAISADSGVW